MGLNFEELDHAETRFGELILRRRRVLSLAGQEVYEVKLGGEFLMSSLVNASEVALVERGLAALDPAPDEGWDVVVGGLGLGCSAATALDDERVAEVLVIEALPEVIAWHRDGLVPLGPRLTGDARCHLRQADFFALAADAAVGFDEHRSGRRFHAVLLDIDHSPEGLLHSDHAAFYEPRGLSALAAQLLPGGVFALWSCDPPDAAFAERLAAVFPSVTADPVVFANPMLDRDDTNSVYVCRVG